MKFSHFIKADNFTEIYKKLQSDLLREGHFIKPRNLLTHELLNVNLVLTNPRERLMYSKVRKHNYTYGAAEFLWYMSGTNRLDFIEFYLPRMKDYSDDGVTVNSAYGYRIFGVHPDFPHQWRNIQYLLLADPETRQAVITVHYQQDLVKPSKDVPCTLNLHFLIRENKLNLFVQMRSNDAFMGLLYDVFSFSLMLEHMFNFLKNQEKLKGLELGTYVHKSDSMHLYERDDSRVIKLLEEKVTEDMYLDSDQLFFNSEQLHSLTADEARLRQRGFAIDSGKYSGICKFMAEKLNRRLTQI